jgi:hypothetical protein
MPIVQQKLSTKSPNSPTMSQGYGTIPVVDQDEEEPETNKHPWRQWVSSRGFFAVCSGVLLLLIWGVYSGSNTVRNPGAVKNKDSVPASSEVERFYNHQRVDHYSQSQDTYNQRYFEDASYFAGPGNPIFVIMGGEDPIEGILYPFVSKVLGAKFASITICVEHRFYGESQPIADDVVTNTDFINYLHPRQALADAVELIQHKSESLGCGPRGTPTYCPVGKSMKDEGSLLRYLIRPLSRSL